MNPWTIPRNVLHKQNYSYVFWNLVVKTIEIMTEINGYFIKRSKVWKKKKSSGPPSLHSHVIYANVPESITS